LVETVENVFAIKIDNYVTVNFDDFIALADMAGGITVTMTADEIYYMNLHIMEVNSIMGITPDNKGIIWDLVDGTYHLDGRQTLGYCKMRELDGTTARYTVTNIHSVLNAPYTAWSDDLVADGALLRVSFKTEDGVFFYPNNTITRAEAAVIINKMLDLKTSGSVEVFHDDNAIPAWAGESVYALTEHGILEGTGMGRFSANTELNRAQTASLLCAVLEFSE